MDVGSKDIRNGRGHRAYRRQQAALKARTKRHGLPCTWCGEPIDTDLPATDPMSFTADHPDALANGGRLTSQVMEPMHRSCNSRKGDGSKDIEIWYAT